MPFIAQSPLEANRMSHSETVLERLTADNLKASVSNLPNKLRLGLRCIQLICSVLSFVFSLIAYTRTTDEEVPFKGLPAITFLFCTAAFSSLASVFFIIDYYRRRMEYKVKMRRVYLIGIDFVILVFWLSDLITLFINVKCPIGALNGWCDFYNTSIFFAVVALSIVASSFIWDLIGTWFQE